MILEVKRADFWHPEDSDARVKARAADAWCKAVNSSGKEGTWEHWVVLDVDVGESNSLQDLKRIRVNAER